MRFVLLTLCVGLAAGLTTHAWADNPSLGAYSDDSGSGFGGSGIPVPTARPDMAITPAAATSVADTAAAPGQTPPAAGGACKMVCYDTANPSTAGCNTSKQCQNLENSDGPMKNYFQNVDRMCNLPAGTAITFGNIESSCRVNIGANGFGYTGLFQFDQNSCPSPNLSDPGVQAQCFCKYTANSKAQYAKVMNGAQPSAGMLYLMHQQGPACGAPLAFGGSQPAYQVIQQCAHKSAAIAIKRIACNMPGTRIDRATKTCVPPSDPMQMTSEQFANTFLSKFNGIGGSSCSIAGSSSATPDALAAVQSTVQQAIASNPILSSFVKAAGGSNVLAQAIANSGNLTANGNPLLASAVLQLLGLQNPAAQFGDTPNPNVDDMTVKFDASDTDADKTDTVTITTEEDGGKTVTVTASDNDNVKTYHLSVGYQLWQCGKAYTDIASGSVSKASMAAKDCKLITEATAKAAK